MKLIKNIGTIFLLFIALLIGYSALSRISGLPELSWFSKKNSFEIENTPVVVREMREIAQLLTQRYYDECVVDTVIVSKSDLLASLLLQYVYFMPKGFYVSDEGVLALEKRYVLIASGMVKAGFDLKEMEQSDVQVLKDSITIFLPEPEIIDVIINPSGFETFEETGVWTFQERKAIQRKALNLLRNNAIRKGILVKSQQQGKKIMTQFFKSLGYAKVGVRIGNLKRN